jgi:hypothetical protein
MEGQNTGAACLTVKGKKSGKESNAAQRFIAITAPLALSHAVLPSPGMSDSRFDRLRTDPRFRRPRKKHAKVVVDERFKGLFTQKKKRKSGVLFNLIDGIN